MKTLAILTRRQDADTDAFERLGEFETQAVWRGMAAGTVRAVHGLAEVSGAALEIETGSAEEARAFVNALPFVAENLLHVQMVPLKPFPAFAALLRSVAFHREHD
ncbi:hypothetical protein PEC18_36790 [Paucibacter sp. O1-1]|nr:hypothetical protein [Paucibacter sp. O1-1]MDA3831211.1 hypothetical protein [Paucibacter sp. O1-1]